MSLVNIMRGQASFLGCSLSAKTSNGWAQTTSSVSYADLFVFHRLCFKQIAIEMTKT